MNLLRTTILISLVCCVILLSSRITVGLRGPECSLKVAYTETGVNDVPNCYDLNEDKCKDFCKRRGAGSIHDYCVVSAGECCCSPRCLYSRRYPQGNCQDLHEIDCQNAGFSEYYDFTNSCDDDFYSCCAQQWAWNPDYWPSSPVPV